MVQVQANTAHSELVADSIIEPILHPGLSIEVKNITVNFSTGSGVYTAVKEIKLL